MYKEVNGDLIELALAGNFDVIVHGCNCMCTQGAGIAKQMVKAFGTNMFPLEKKIYEGDINKLGQIDYWKPLKDSELYVVNAYTQFDYKKDKINFDYSAFILILKKLNHIFKGKHIGMPRIGAGLAGGDWGIIKQMLNIYLKDVDITIVNYNK